MHRVPSGGPRPYVPNGSAAEVREAGTVLHHLCRETRSLSLRSQRGYTEGMPTSAVRAAILVLAAIPWFSGGVPAGAQVAAPAGALHPVLLLEGYVDTSALLLTPPSSLDLISAIAAPPSATSPFESLRDVDRRVASTALRLGQMGAYQDFERNLGLRAGSVARAGASAAERSRAKRAVLTGVSERLERLPGAALVRYGRDAWRRIEDSTNFEVEGYRIRLRLGEALEGKLALKVQKDLR